MVHTITYQIITKSPLILALAPKDRKKLKMGTKIPKNLQPQLFKNIISNIRS